MAATSDLDVSLGANESFKFTRTRLAVAGNLSIMFDGAYRMCLSSENVCHSASFEGQPINRWLRGHGARMLTDISVDSPRIARAESLISVYKCPVSLSHKQCASSSEYAVLESPTFFSFHSLVVSKSRKGITSLTSQSHNSIFIPHLPESEMNYPCGKLCKGLLLVLKFACVCSGKREATLPANSQQLIMKWHWIASIRTNLQNSSVLQELITILLLVNYWYSHIGLDCIVIKKRFYSQILWFQFLH